MNFDWKLLNFSELMIMLFVAVELIVVFVALGAMLWVRSSSMRRQQAYNAVRTRLIDTVGRMGGSEDDTALLQSCAAVLAGLQRDQQRRLLTELAEYAGSAGSTTDPVFAQLFTLAGLVPDARANAASRPWERLRVIREARALGDPAGLLEKLVRDDVPDVRLGAFEALCSLGRADEALVALTAVAQDGRLNRLRATDALSLARPLPADELIALVESPAAEVRQIAVAVLGQARHRTALDTLINACADVDAEVRIQALRALGELRDATGLGVILAALDDDRWEVRSEAAKAAGILALPGSAERLGKAMEDEAEWVRHNVALALVKCGQIGVATLRQAAADGNPAAQAALAEARMTPTEGPAPSLNSGRATAGMAAR